jgi:hypothetical protein
VERCLESISSTKALTVIETYFLFRYSRSSVAVDLQDVTSPGYLHRLLFMVVGSTLTKYFSLEFQDRRMQIGHDSRTIMIGVAQRQHGGTFLRLARDPRISVVDNSAADTEARAIFFFHEVGCLVENFFEWLTELLLYRIALLIDNIQEASYVSTLSGHALSRVCFTSSRVVWDRGIIFSFNLVQSMEH